MRSKKELNVYQKRKTKENIEYYRRITSNLLIILVLQSKQNVNYIE